MSVSVRCPAGSYYSGLQEKCVLCKAGTYQPKEGYLRCYECPKGTWTVGDDAKNFTACRGKVQLLNQTHVNDSSATAN